MHVHPIFTYNNEPIINTWTYIGCKHFNKPSKHVNLLCNIDELFNCFCLHRKHFTSCPKHQLLLLFLWLFPSSGVAAMVVDRLFLVSHVSFIALSQSYSLHVPLAHTLPPCLWYPSLPFPGIAFVITLLTT